MDQQEEKDKTEGITGLGRRTREEIAKWNQMTALRFETRGKHRSYPASLRRCTERHLTALTLQFNLLTSICTVCVVFCCALFSSLLMMLCYSHSPVYDKATSAVLFNSSIGDWLRTTVGVRQGCLLSPTRFNIFLERILTDALEDHEGTVSTGGRTITNLRFADDIDGLAREEEELANLVEHLDKASTAYGMEISTRRPS